MMQNEPLASHHPVEMPAHRGEVFRVGLQTVCLKCRDWDRSAVTACDEVSCRVLRMRHILDAGRVKYRSMT